MPRARPDLEDALDRLDRLLVRVDAEMTALGLSCRACGACCRFDEADHVLYASRIEVIRLLRIAGDPPTAPPLRCPWQDGDRCTARRGRVLGCRLHMCDPRDRGDALEALSAKAHETLRAVHDDCGQAYVYAPLLDLLEEESGLFSADRTS